MKTLYIFDMGNVLAFECGVLPDIISYLNINEEDFFNYTGGNYTKFLNGMISSDEFWARFSLGYGGKVEEELFAKFFNP